MIGSTVDSRTRQRVNTLQPGLQRDNNAKQESGQHDEARRRKERFSGQQQKENQGLHSRGTPPSGNGNLKALLYALFNISSASAIVFANKAVFVVHHFNFAYSLTLVHTVVTMIGMWAFSSAGIFHAKKLPVLQVTPLALAFVGYIVLGNLNLKFNTVSFYQITKIAVAPAVLTIEFALYNRVPSATVIASVMFVCIGIGFATVSELENAQGWHGTLAGLGAVLSTALYQVWVGAKQKELAVSSMQLLHQCAPQSSMMLAIAVLLMEQPQEAESSGPIAYTYTPEAIATIAFSAFLGLAVSLSTFLVIGSTSSLTYNVVGHVKTSIIIGGGVVLFGETIPPTKMMGLIMAMAGIVAYSILKIKEGTLINRSLQQGAGQCS